MLFSLCILRERCSFLKAKSIEYKDHAKYEDEGKRGILLKIMARVAFNFLFSRKH
jgi:hypothetical protein